jgi:hypothetical protein
MPEKPEEVLPQDWTAAAADLQCLAGDDESARHKEAGAGHAVHELEHRGRLKRRKCQQKQERSDELRPDEERQAHQRHPRRAQLNDRHDHVDRADHRRHGEHEHSNQPDGLAHRRDVGERGIRRPARRRGAARHEEPGHHHETSHEVQPVTERVQARKRHVRRANHQRDEVVAERQNQRHDREEHHDGAVHRAELEVELGQQNAFDRARFTEQLADQRQGIGRRGEVPS